MAEGTPVCDFGWEAPAFSLPGVDGKTYSLDRLRGPNGTLVMFICNHCPYVLAVADRLVRDAHALQALGVGCVAINANDATAYPEDAPERMPAFAQQHGFGFPYLHDATQAVAHAYGAVCTPDFFGYNAALELQYRGRLDASGRQPAPPDVRRELYEAMAEVARSGLGPTEQTASIGCSIKWRG